MENNDILYQKIITSISKEVRKTLFEELQGFNPVDYAYDSDDIIDKVDVDDVLDVPKTKKDLVNIIYNRALKNNQELDLNDIDVSYITDMSDLFHQYTYFKFFGIDASYIFETKVKKIDISSWDTSNVTDMRDMFSCCRNLETVKHNMNTSNVENMHGMFSGCHKLRNLNISKFDTSKVQDMSLMFMACHSIKKLNLQNFRTSNVTTFDSMFYGCHSLIKLNISNFSFNKITQTWACSFMFNECFSLYFLKMPNIDQHVLDSISSKCLYSIFSEISRKQYFLITPKWYKKIFKEMMKTLAAEAYTSPHFMELKTFERWEQTIKRIKNGDE